MDTIEILDEIENKLPRGKMRELSLAEIKNKLDLLSDDERTNAFLRIETKIKNPIVVDVCNFFFGNFGVARFMIGDIGLGIARLVFLFICLLVAISDDGSEEMEFTVIAFTASIWIWWLIDLILVEKKVRMQNLRKILLTIDSAKNNQNKRKKSMKKLIWFLIMSLGLVSVVNAESVCETLDEYTSWRDKWKASNHYDYGFVDEYMVYELASVIEDKYITSASTATKAQEKSNKQIEDAWDKLISTFHIGEIKKSEKESLCLYMQTTITDYLKTTLTSQEIERFEKYLVENNDYKYYEKNKDKYLNALKFLKHFNKLEYWYSKKHDSGMLANIVSGITNHNNDDNVTVKAIRVVYGKPLGGAIANAEGHYLDEMKHALDACATRSCAEDKIKDLKNVVQWAESKLKEAKQRNSQ